MNGPAKKLLDLSTSHTLIFDLDNTIYDEKEFLFGAYRDIAKHLDRQYGLNSAEVFEFMTSNFLKNGRDKLFNCLVERYGFDNRVINDCLQILRAYVRVEQIEPYNYFIEYLSHIKCSTIVHIITNGNIEQQSNKVKSLKLGRLRKCLNVVYSNKSAPKPATDSFSSLNKAYTLIRPIYIGDSKEDEIFANNCGIGFISIGHLLDSNK